MKRENDNNYFIELKISTFLDLKFWYIFSIFRMITMG